MISISVDASEITAAIQRVSQFIRALHHREDLNQELKEDQNERWARNFAGRGAEYDSWDPTSKSYQKRRQREGYSSTPTLERSGRTLTHFLEQNDEATVANTAVTWNFSNRIAGRNGAYTVSHHTGYTLGKSRVPARLLWDLDGEDEDRGEQTTERWLDTQVERYL